MKNAVKLLMLLLPATACNGELFAPVSEVVDVAGNTGHDMIVLGDRLDDPYTVENMTAALFSVYGTKADRVVLKATDYYVRFLPQGEDDYDRLAALGVSMIDHPVDYEIVREGDYYHDPEIEEGKITWQYAVVKKDFEFPSDIKYEVLDDCYLSDNDASTKADWIDWNAVERESFRLTGNEEMLLPATKAGGGCPSGKITIVDDLKGGAEGVRGVKVSCNSFVKFANCYTNENGEYEMSRSFASDVRYRLVFKNKCGFAIGFNLLLVPASISSFGKHSADGLDVQIDRNSERKLFCRSVVNNACYDYYADCEAKGMQKPPANLRLWLFQLMNCSSAPMLQQGALIDDSILADFLGEYISLLKMFLPDVTLGLRGYDDYSSIYSLAIHEMAHGSHFMQAGKSYWNKFIKFILVSFVTSGFTTYGVGTESDHGYCDVAESWSYYVQTMFYRERYEDETAVFGTSYWFRPQILLSLDERGLARQKIFAALTSDITDREMLQKKLVSLYPDMKTTVNQIFGRYDE